MQLFVYALSLIINLFFLTSFDLIATSTFPSIVQVEESQVYSVDSFTVISVVDHTTSSNIYANLSNIMDNQDTLNSIYPDPDEAMRPSTNPYFQSQHVFGANSGTPMPPAQTSAPISASSAASIIDDNSSQGTRSGHQNPQIGPENNNSSIPGLLVPDRPAQKRSAPGEDMPIDFSSKRQMQNKAQEPEAQQETNNSQAINTPTPPAHPTIFGNPNIASSASPPDGPLFTPTPNLNFGGSMPPPSFPGTASVPNSPDATNSSFFGITAPLADMGFGGSGVKQPSVSFGPSAMPTSSNSPVIPPVPQFIPNPEFIAMMEAPAQIDKLLPRMQTLKMNLAKEKKKRLSVLKRNESLRRELKRLDLVHKQEAITCAQSKTATLQQQIDENVQLRGDLAAKTTEYNALHSAVNGAGGAREGYYKLKQSEDHLRQQLDVSKHSTGTAERLRDLYKGQHDAVDKKLSKQIDETASVQAKLDALQRDFDDLKKVQSKQTPADTETSQSQPITPPQSPPKHDSSHKCCWNQDELDEAKLEAENAIIGKYQFALKMANIKVAGFDNSKEALHDKISDLERELANEREKHNGELASVDKTLREETARVVEYERSAQAIILSVGEVDSFASMEPLDSSVQAVVDEVRNLRTQVGDLRTQNSTLSTKLTDRDTTIDNLNSGISIQFKEIEALESDLKVAKAAREPPTPEEKLYLVNTIVELRQDKTIMLGEYLDVKNLVHKLDSAEDDLKKANRREKDLAAQVQLLQNESLNGCTPSTDNGASTLQQATVKEPLPCSLVLEAGLSNSISELKNGSEKESDVTAQSARPSSSYDQSLELDLLDDVGDQKLIGEHLLDSVARESVMGATLDLEDGADGLEARGEELFEVLAPESVGIEYFTSAVVPKVLTNGIGMDPKPSASLPIIKDSFAIFEEEFYDALEEQPRTSIADCLPDTAKFLLLFVGAIFVIGLALLGFSALLVEVKACDNIIPLLNIQIWTWNILLQPRFNLGWPIRFLVWISEVVSGTRDGRGGGGGRPPSASLLNIAGCFTADGWLPR